jgi:hypothetical protein
MQEYPFVGQRDFRVGNGLFFLSLSTECAWSAASAKNLPKTRTQSDPHLRLPASLFPQDFPSRGTTIQFQSGPSSVAARYRNVWPNCGSGSNTGTPPRQPPAIPGSRSSQARRCPPNTARLRRLPRPAVHPHPSEAVFVGYGSPRLCVTRQRYIASFPAVGTIIQSIDAKLYI